jgi:hypothetical protein
MYLSKGIFFADTSFLFNLSFYVAWDGKPGRYLIVEIVGKFLGGLGLGLAILL